MHNFVLRIYRTGDLPNDIFGMMEDISHHRTQSFHSFSELSNVIMQALAQDDPEPLQDTLSETEMASQPERRE